MIIMGPTTAYLTKEDSSISTYIKSDIVLMDRGRTVTSAVIELQDQIDTLKNQNKRNKSFAWRHAKKRKRRYW